MNLLLIAIAPVAIILFYVYSKDKYDQEPLTLILKLVFFGVLICIPAAILEMLLEGPLLGDGSSVTQVFIYSFMGIALVEEGFKYIALKQSTWKSVFFNERFDGIVYGVAVSLGFAAFENILYVAGGGMGIGILRAFTAVPMHGVLGVLMGVLYGKARFAGAGSWALRFKSLAIPTFFHGLYDFFALSSGTGKVDLSGYLYLLLIGLVIYAIQTIKREAFHKEKQRFFQSEEVMETESIE